MPKSRYNPPRRQLLPRMPRRTAQQLGATNDRSAEVESEDRNPDHVDADRMDLDEATDYEEEEDDDEDDDSEDGMFCTMLASNVYFLTDSRLD